MLTVESLAEKIWKRVLDGKPDLCEQDRAQAIELIKWEIEHLTILDFMNSYGFLVGEERHVPEIVITGGHRPGKATLHKGFGILEDLLRPQNPFGNKSVLIPRVALESALAQEETDEKGRILGRVNDMLEDVKLSRNLLESHPISWATDALDREVKSNDES